MRRSRNWRSRGKKAKETAEIVMMEEAERNALQKRMMHIVSGIFPYVIDDRTFEILKYVIRRIWGNRFLIDPEDMEIDVPQDINIHDVRNGLTLSGFYMKLTKDRDNVKKALKIGIMRASFTSDVPLRDQTLDVFSADEDEHVLEDIGHVLKPLLASGLIGLDGLSNVSISEDADIESIREMIRSTGYHGDILYDPIHVLNSSGRRIIARNGDEIYVIDDFDSNALKEKTLDLWKDIETKALLDAEIREHISGKGETIDSIIGPYLDEICLKIIDDFHYTKAFVYPDFPGHEYIMKIKQEDIV